MFDNILAFLNTISEFVAKILDAIKQAFNSLKPVEPSEEATGE